MSIETLILGHRRGCKTCSSGANPAATAFALSTSFHNGEISAMAFENGENSRSLTLVRLCE
jgi:hypothetical protein